MTPRLSRYKSNLRDLRFVLFEQLGFEDILGKAPFQDWGRDEVDMVLGETERFAREVPGPLSAVGDRVGCKLENGKVVTPPGFKDAWDKLYEAGWRSLAIPESHGGQGAPHTLSAAVEEFLSGSNTSFAMYAGLTNGAAELISQCGAPPQIERYLGNMVSGKWAGTMCLTEPHAGTDVGSADRKSVV